MKIQMPTVGPIIGHTTADEVRIWLRGRMQETDDGYNRCFGVVQIRTGGTEKWGEIRFTKMPPHFDMTGICVFANLKPSTQYEYRAGWFFAETALDNLDSTQDLSWDKAVISRFETKPKNNTSPRSYVIGSCRYLLKLFGGDFFDERGDKTFGSILAQIKNGQRVDSLIMVGDQIYADDLNFVGQDTKVDQFFQRYREVFGQPLLKTLMSQVPTYMVLDDHEIEDNWPSKASDKDRHTLYPSAIHAYQTYQCSHSPLFTVGSDGRIDGTLTKFWYTFRDGCCDWFFMDCRTERVWDEDPLQRRMIKESQMQALLAWLKDGSGLVKMVVSSVPFIPDLDSDSDDKWCGHLVERTRILDFILENKIRKVVFVSGDVHCSFSAELTSNEDPEFKIISVVSSSFFWPYPHMQQSDFVLKGKLRTHATTNAYQVKGASEVYSTDNFCRMEVSPDGLQLSFYERKGEILGKVVKRSFVNKK